MIGLLDRLTNCRCGVKFWGWLLMCHCAVLAADELAPSVELFELRDLMNMEVVSSNKFKQDLSEVTSSIYIITADDIKQSGASDLPTLLKQIPGLFIAEVSANNWAMGIRGFNSVFSNKILVMVDGRSLFSPVFSGVFWDQLDLFLPDILRIEVIRGVGSTVWGANAVNGVINIITKSTLDSNKNVAYAQVRNDNHYDFGVSLGKNVDETVDETSSMRFYAKTKKIASNDYLQMDGVVDDSWSSAAGGFKWQYYNGADSFAVSGDYIAQDVNESSMLITSRAETNYVPLKNDVYNLSMHWQRQMDIDKAFTWSAQLQSSQRDSQMYRLKDVLTNFEFDTNFTWMDHTILLGAGARLHDIEFNGFPGYELIRNDTLYETNMSIYSIYFQDEWRWAPRHEIILGAKFEEVVYDDRNSDFRYEDPVWLPTIRYRYHLSEQSKLWLAVSRSARIPSFSELSIKIPLYMISIPGQMPLEVFSSGNEDFVKEKLLSYELGVRSQLNKNNHVEMAIFHNQYDDVRTFVLDYTLSYDLDTCLNNGNIYNCPPPGVLWVDNTFTNNAAIMIKGIELSWFHRISNSLNINFHYTGLFQDETTKTAAQEFEESTLMSPKYQFTLQANWQYNDDWNVFFLYKYTGGVDVEDLPILSSQSAYLPEYQGVDITVSYQFDQHTRLTFRAENLLQAAGKRWTAEFPDSKVSLIDKRFNIGLELQF